MTTEKTVQRILIVQELLNDSKQRIEDRVIQCEAIIEGMNVESLPTEFQRVFYSLSVSLNDAHAHCRVEDDVTAAMYADDALRSANDLISLLSPIAATDSSTHK